VLLRKYQSWLLSYAKIFQQANKYIQARYSMSKGPKNKEIFIMKLLGYLDHLDVILGILINNLSQL